MALMHTPEKTENFIAPDFLLKNIDGNNISLNDVMGEHGLLVMFICNHCPYVIAIIDRLVKTCETLTNEGIGCVAIMPNDTVSYPQDSYENMKLFANQHGFTFPYLIDITQETAKSYDAVCTPDFFGFDKEGILQYRGRLDSAMNKAQDNDTVPELLNYMISVKKNNHPNGTQSPSMGCSIKWKNQGA
ncbi:MAG: thioredoxin family protein [Alphaproteobacteria bacterium]